MPLSGFSQTERILTERRRMDGPLLWTVWVSAATFSLAEGQWFYLVAATFGVVANMLAVRRAKEVYVHRAFVNIGVLVATAILAIEVYAMAVKARQLTLLQALGHYLILLQMCKLFQQKRNRDYTQLLALSALLMIASGMMTNEPWFAASLTVYIALLCYTAMVFTLKRGLDAVARGRLATDAGPIEISRVAWSVSRAWPGRAMRRRGVLILAAVLGTGVMVFLAAPRKQLVDPELLGAAGSASRFTPSGVGTASTGFSNQVVLGDVSGQIYQSNAVLMHVRIGDYGRKIPLAHQARYLRGATFNRYRGSIWSKMRLGHGSSLDGGWPRTRGEALFGGGLTEHISMDSSLLPYLFVSFPALDVRECLGLLPDLTFRLDREEATPTHVSYTVRCLSYPLTTWRQAWVERYTNPQGPADPADGVDATDPVKELAQEWCSDLLEQRTRQPENKDQLDLAIAARISENLKKNYSYTLDLTGVDPSRDGVEDFLLHMKSGHCEYFASAMTVMCRILGVQARLVTGFVMHEYNADAAHYVVRGRDAHAWTEVYTPSGFWQVVDATPPTARRAHGRVWAASVRQYWNDLKFLWYEKVVGYDAADRNRALEWLKNRLSTIVTTLKRSARNLFFHGIVDRALVHIAIMTGLAGLVGEALLIRRWVRRAGKAKRALPIPPKKIAFINKLLSLLERRGFPLRAEQTLRDLAVEAAAGSDLPPEALDELVALYYRIRWGQQIPDEHELRAAEREVDALGQRLQRSY